MRNQVAKEGFVLTNGIGLYVKSIDLGVEAELWQEVEITSLPEDVLLQLYESELNQLENDNQETK